tara:strand:- start:677 stop:1057 length:381 start_codon:yes stop_codon:yes gene_type:complete
MEKIINELTNLKIQKKDLFFAYDKKLIEKEEFLKLNNLVTEAIEFKEIELSLEKIEKSFNNMPPEFFEMFSDDFDLLQYEIEECIEFVNSNNVEMKYKKEKLKKVEELNNKAIEKFESMPFFITEK